MKRLSLRSISASRSMSGTPATWLRRPSSAYSGMKRMPGRSSRNDVPTAAASLPRQDTMPMPVTTTRFAGFISKSLRGAEQPDPQVLGDIDLAPVDESAAVGDHHAQLAAQDPVDVDFVGHPLRLRQHLAAELDLADAQRPATPR